MQERSDPHDSMADQPRRDPKRGPRGHKALLVVAALVVSLVVVVPFFFSRHTLGNSSKEGIKVVQTHDLGNLIPMMEQYDKVLRSGAPYPRWTPEWNKGYGTATFNFYPPFLFYLTTAVHALVTDWVDTVFLISAVSLAASGLAFYFLSRIFFSRLAGSIAALVYMLLPFHQMDLYWRGGITQFVGYVFLPLVLYFSFKLGKEGGARYYAAFGFTHGLYILTHLPVSYIFTYVLVFYALVWSAKTKDFRILLRIAGGIALALLVSAIYWLPAALEGKYAYEWTTQIFPYHSNYITLMPVTDAFLQLIQDIFTFHAIALITVILVLRKIPRPATRRLLATGHDDKAGADAELQTRIWVILGIATIFMTTDLSIYISRLIPKIQLAVPPFRWLAIASLFLALLIAASVDRLHGREVSKPKLLLACRIAVGAAIALNLWLTVHGVMIRALANPTHEVVFSQYGDSGATPKNSTLPHLLPDGAQVVITPEAKASEVIQWLPIHREVAVQLDQPSDVRIKTYNFPGWIAHIDGQRVPISSDNDGVQIISVPSGIHRIETDFVSTPPRTAGSLVSGIGVLLLFGLSFAGRARRLRIAAQEGPEKPPQEEPEKPRTTEPGSIIASATKSRNITPLKALGLIAIVLIIGATVVVITSKQSRPAGSRSQGGGSSDKPAPRSSLGTGSETHLYLSGQESVIVAVDEKALDQIVSALSGRDTAALDALVSSGRAMRVPNNTSVRVLETGSGKTKVRILEGEHVLLDAWVPERWLR